MNFCLSLLAAQFQLKYKSTGILPVITITDSIIAVFFPNLRSWTTDAADYVTMVDDGSEWILTVGDISRTGDSIDVVTITFLIQLPAFQHEFEADNIECNFLDSSDAVVLAASTIEVGTRDTSTLPSSLNTLTVATSSTETGAYTTLTLSYTTVYTYLASSWFYIFVPKANVDYSANSGEAVSLISSTDASSPTVTIDGVSFGTISSASLTVGSGYTYDTWSFFVSDSTTFTSGTQAITITVPITNPEMVTTLSSDWLL